MTVRWSTIRSVSSRCQAKRITCCAAPKHLSQNEKWTKRLKQIRRTFHCFSRRTFWESRTQLTKIMLECDEPANAHLAQLSLSATTYQRRDKLLLPRSPFNVARGGLSGGLTSPKRTDERLPVDTSSVSSGFGREMKSAKAALKDRGRRGEKKRRENCRPWAKPLLALINNDLNQEFTSSHSKVLIGAVLSARIMRKMKS